MADSEKRESSLKSWLVIGIFAAVLLYLLDQGRIMRRILGPLWNIAGKSLSMAMKALHEAGATVDDWIRDAWTRLKAATYWTLTLVGMFFMTAIAMHEKTGSDAPKILVIAGGIALVLLAAVWVFTLRLMVVICVLGIGTAAETGGSLLRRFKIQVPSLQVTGAEISRALSATRGLSLLPDATLCLSVFLLVFTTWAGLIAGLTLAFIAWAIVRLSARAGWEPKKGYAFIAWMFIAIAVVIGARFVLMHFFPEVRESWSLRPIGRWLADPKLGPRGWLAVLLGIPSVLFLISAFASDGRKGSWRTAAKYTLVLSGIIAVPLYRSGKLTDSGSGEKPPAASTKTTQGSDKAFGNAYEGSSKHALQGTTSNGDLYTAPPSGDPTSLEVAPSVRPTPKPRAKKRPLPPLEAKEYKDVAEAYEDLDSF